MTNVVFSNQAHEDLDRIWLYIGSHNIQAADGIIDGIENTIDVLRTFPGSGSRKDEIRPGFRMLVHHAYNVFYEYYEKEDLVEIVTIVEGMRNWPQMIH